MSKISKMSKSWLLKEQKCFLRSEKKLSSAKKCNKMFLKLCSDPKKQCSSTWTIYFPKDLSGFLRMTFKSFGMEWRHPFIVVVVVLMLQQPLFNFHNNVRHWKKKEPTKKLFFLSNLFKKAWEQCLETFGLNIIGRNFGGLA